MSPPSEPASASSPDRTFAPRRSTDPAIAAAIGLGWRIAELYSLRASELASSPPENLLPVRTSLAPADRLQLELRAAAGDAKRVGAEIDDDELDELVKLAQRAAASDAVEYTFRARIKSWHITLATDLWADCEAKGKAYELGSFLSDTWNRMVLALRRCGDGDGDAEEQIACELSAVFAVDRVRRIERLLDDLQARIDPAAVRVVQQHLRRWQETVQQRAGQPLPFTPTREGLRPLANQTVIWCQLVTGDKEPEAYIGRQERASLRDTMAKRIFMAHRDKWKAVLLVAALVALVTVLVVRFGDDLASYKPALGAVLAFLGSLAGALGLSAGSIALTVRKSINARAELIWNTALVGSSPRRRCASARSTRTRRRPARCRGGPRGRQRPSRGPRPRRP